MPTDKITRDLIANFTAVMAPNPMTWTVGYSWLAAMFDSQQKIIGNIAAIWKFPPP